MSSDETERNSRRLTRAVDVVETQLRAMKGDLERLHRQIKAGQVDRITDSARATQEIRQWLRIAMELEVQLAKEKSRHDGRDAPRAINLDDARSEIGCRLDRLRRTCRAGRVSE
ncbi:hypothetical protein [Marimonas lutisalis]|uniref:hypothetical protein n=1 Tax=Marimonas lutisalis TaxID=2545756 RepID=UPI0013755F18|nr:hypothetical protein [Marimonas lutisalis]